MTVFNCTTRFMSAAMLVAVLGGCGQDGGNSGSPGTGGSAASTAALGPLTGQEICDRLPATEVGRITGLTVSSAQASTAGTPQCSYDYTVGTSRANIVLSYQRPDGDLGGNQGEAGFDHALRINQSLVRDAQQQDLQAGQRATRLSGSNMHIGILLTAGRVMTVTGFTSTLTADKVDQLVRTVAETFGR